MAEPVTGEANPPAPLHNQSRPRLPTIPAEIRLQIYQYTDPDVQAIRFLGGSPALDLKHVRSALHQTCQLLRAELSGDQAPKVRLYLTNAKHLLPALRQLTRDEASRLSNITATIHQPHSVQNELKSWHAARLNQALPRLELPRFHMQKERGAHFDRIFVIRIQRGTSRPQDYDALDREYMKIVRDWGKSFAADNSGLLALEPAHSLDDEHMVTMDVVNTSRPPSA